MEHSVPLHVTPCNTGTIARIDWIVEKQLELCRNNAEHICSEDSVGSKPVLRSTSIKTPSMHGATAECLDKQTELADKGQSHV